MLYTIQPSKSVTPLPTPILLKLPLPLMFTNNLKHCLSLLELIPSASVWANERAFNKLLRGLVPPPLNAGNA